MRLIDADAFLERFEKMCETELDNVIAIILKGTLINEPTAYDIDRVVEELKEAMQDLSVIEILSHIDFDSTIQSGLDNFLKAYNSELLRIVKHGCVSDDVCEWKYTKEIMDNAEFKVGCNQNALKRGIVPNNFSYHDFKYCPYCGKKIKVVGD